MLEVEIGCKNEGEPIEHSASERVRDTLWEYLREAALPACAVH